MLFINNSNHLYSSNFDSDIHSFSSVRLCAITFAQAKFCYIVNFFLYVKFRGGTVAQWVALSPHSKCSIPGQATMVLSVWTLHVLPMSVWVCSRCSGHANLPLGMWV